MLDESTEAESPKFRACHDDCRTPEEREALKNNILSLVTLGLTQRQIAQQIGIHTISNYYGMLRREGRMRAFPQTKRAMRPGMSKGQPSEHRKPIADMKFDVKTRACLTCGSNFKSEWKGNRICRSCKTTRAWSMGI